ncbi:MAG: fluoride efflux transporter CrcB [Tepidimonas sp.]|uniref:fluoride efflux transporter CrcB n=1 Tax=Tepidimonas sp. TaxID=2002775 RepID=UPI00298EEDC0|nr:fluoride efflux transporter CrcB [Tepidimonas sp.]MCS6810521.1 fluoride efflux transporter CrcB [Tepidimonas sp.]MDW8335712.1 fluoride efflux transporter CrcB [Tepidimonas sp.]
MIASVAAIAAGASLGALLRWWLGLALNALLPHLPLGTLAANWIGGYAIGLVAGFFMHHPAVAPEWRLFAITGLLGGLTTFSSFSIEMTTLLQQGRLLWALAGIGLHVGGSLLLTALGLASYGWLRGL